MYNLINGVRFLSENFDEEAPGWSSRTTIDRTRTEKSFVDVDLRYKMTLPT